ncbi:hypothetical protein GZH49_01335 [Nocardia terpenica]
MILSDFHPDWQRDNSPNSGTACMVHTGGPRHEGRRRTPAAPADPTPTP